MSPEHQWREGGGAMTCDDCGAHLVVDFDLYRGTVTLRVADGRYRCGMRVHVPCPKCTAPYMVDAGRGQSVCRVRACDGVFPPPRDYSRRTPGFRR